MAFRAKDCGILGSRYKSVTSSMVVACILGMIFLWSAKVSYKLF